MDPSINPTKARPIRLGGTYPFLWAIRSWAFFSIANDRIPVRPLGGETRQRKNSDNTNNDRESTHNVENLSILQVGVQERLKRLAQKRAKSGR